MGKDELFMVSQVFYFLFLMLTNFVKKGETDTKDGARCEVGSSPFKTRLEKAHMADQTYTLHP